MRSTVCGAVTIMIWFNATAMAASLPLDGAYGSTNTCRLFKQGGVEAVYGLSNGSDVLMTSTMLISREMLIEEFKVAGISSYTAVNDDDMNGKFTMNIALLPSDPGSLTVQFDDQAPITLIKCR